VRSEKGDGIFWDIPQGKIDVKKLEGVSHCIHLAGYTVSHRWNAKRKEEIRRSRVEGTKILVEGLAQLKEKPKALLATSANGYYGDRGDEILTEESSLGKEGFLPEVVQAWEKEILKAEALGIRVVVFRLGIVLSTQGGALNKMLLPFKCGLGGSISHGRQWMSWISLRDVIRAFTIALEDEKYRGIYNLVSPQAVTNREFSKSLGKALHRPTILPLPAFQVRLLFGEMGKELLLGSIRCVPSHLEKTGFTFEDPSLDSALEKIIAQKL
jgi:uncharacterized protein (TIGR01777 family)